MNFGALPEGKVGLGIPHGAPPPLVWGTQIIQEFNEGLVLNKDLFGVPQTQWAGTHGE